MSIIERDYKKYAHDACAELLNDVSANPEVAKVCAEDIIKVRGWYMMTVVDDDNSAIPDSKVLDAYEEVSHALFGIKGMKYLMNLDTWLSGRKHEMMSKIWDAAVVMRHVEDMGTPAYMDFVDTVAAPSYKIGPGEYGLLHNLYMTSVALLGNVELLKNSSYNWDDVLADCLGTIPDLYKEKLDL